MNGLLPVPTAVLSYAATYGRPAAHPDESQTRADYDDDAMRAFQLKMVLRVSPPLGFSENLFPYESLTSH